METILKCEGLYTAVDGRVLIEDLNMELHEGDYLLVVGRNGSGKTTLMKTLLGILPPYRGKIEYYGGSERGAVGYLPQQNAMQDDFPATVREIVMSGCIRSRKNHFFFDKKDRETADTYMEKMDIKDLEKECYADLSGGQKQRVLIARALCSTEKLLLLDEPVSGLDPDTAQEMYSVVEELNAGGTTIIMISHDVENAVGYADHILEIDDAVFFGTVDEYLDSKEGDHVDGITG